MELKRFVEIVKGYVLKKMFLNELNNMQKVILIELIFLDTPHIASDSL